jgi:hypothetical protein
LSVEAVCITRARADGNPNATSLCTGPSERSWRSSL